MHITVYAAPQLGPELRAALGMYRRQVFIERLGWPLVAPDGLEFDQFDTQATVYMIARDAEGVIVGCARLLPTTGPYLLRCVFAQLLDGDAAPDSPDIMELSRFAAMDLRRRRVALAESASLASELMNAVLHYASERSVSSLVAVSSPAVQTLLRRAVFYVQRGRVLQKVDGCWIHVCWISTLQRSPCSPHTAAHGAHA